MTELHLRRLDALAVGLLAVGYLLIVAGVAVVHWPVGLVVAGAGLLIFGHKMARFVAAAGAAASQQPKDQ